VAEAVDRKNDGIYVVESAKNSAEKFLIQISGKHTSSGIMNG